MKNKLTIIFISVCLIVATAVACGVKNNDFDDDYDFVNPAPKEIVYDTDEGVKLDGVMDEDFWKSEHEWYVGNLSDGSKGKNPLLAGHIEPCEMRVTTQFTEKGLYFYAEVDDKIINVYRKKNDLAAYQKTGISFYVAEPGMINTSDGTGAYEFALAVDGTSLLRRHYRGGYNAYPLIGVGWGTRFINGNLDEYGNGTAYGYAIEAFIPWNLIKLDGKPEYLNVAFAVQRHENTGHVGSEFTWEWNPQGEADWYKPDTWLKFTDNGLYTAKPADKTIDGDAADWLDYAGEVKRLDYPDGKRYVEHKIIRGTDGLYVLTDAVQRLYLTEKEWWENTSIEVLVTNKNGGNVSYALDGSGYSARYTAGVMTAEDVTLDGANYKHITAEYFIPDFALSFGATNKSDDGIDVDEEYLRVGVAFANGTGEKLYDGTLDPDKNESTNKSQLMNGTCLDAKPYLVYPLGCGPWEQGRRFYVTKRGITAGAITRDERFSVDGNADDWQNYRGVTARATGRADGDDRSSVGKGFEVKAVKGIDGAYFYAVVRHSALLASSKDKYDVSGLTVKFSVTDTAYTGSGDYKNGKNGWETYFTIAGNDAGAECAQIMRTQRTADGLYETIIEGFVPFWRMGDFSDLTAADGKPAFDKNTGRLSDGFVLRMGFRWRTKGDAAFMQGSDAATDGWLNAQLPINNPQNHYIIDENGLHQSRLVPSYGVIDGKPDDGIYYGETMNAASTDNERYARTKAIMREDGLYVTTIARVENYVETAKTPTGAKGIDAAAFKNNSSLELRYIDSTGKNAVFANISPAGTSFVTNWVPEIEYEYGVVVDGEYTLVVIASENIDVRASAAKYYEPDGTFAPESVTVVYNDGTTAVTLIEDVDYTLGSVVYDGADGGSASLTIIGKGLFGGSTTAVYTINQYRYMTDAKLGATINGELIYTGSEITPDVVVTWDGETLTENVDYTIEFSDNVNAGEATLTVIAAGERYKAQADKPFTIAPRDIASATLTVPENLKYTGREVKPLLSVSDGSVALGRDVDYTVTYSGDLVNLVSDSTKNYGEATVTATGKGNYTGTATLTYRFASAATAKRVDGNISDWTDYNGNKSVIYNGGNTKGAEIMAKHESDGVYVFASVRHATLVANSGNPQNDTHLRVIFALQTGTSYASGDQIYVGANGNYKYWSKDYTNYYDAVESAFLTTGQEGDYVTYVEVFVPASRFSNVTDGTDLRVGFSWYAPGEDEKIFGKNTGTTWGPMGRWTNTYNADNAANFYYLDKNTDAINRGLRYGKFVAEDRAIDGDVSDWADYDAAGNSVWRTEGSLGRYIEYRAYYGADGMYLSTESLTDKIVIGNRPVNGSQQDLSNSYLNNTSWELKLGGKDMGMAYGYHTAYYSSKYNLVEFAVKYEKQANGQYLTGMELFIPSAAYEELGLTLTNGKPIIETWVYGCKKATNYVVTEYEAFKTESGAAASSWATDYQWFGGRYRNDDSSKTVYIEIPDYVKAARA